MIKKRIPKEVQDRLLVLYPPVARNVVPVVDLTDPFVPGSFEYYRNALSEFLVSLSDNYQHFLFGTRTNNTESFHSVCNQYYTKGLTVSFDTYKKRKYFAGLH